MAKLNYASPLSHTNTSKILQRILNLIEVRRDLGNRASLVNRAYVKRLSVWCQLTWHHFTKDQRLPPLLAFNTCFTSNLVFSNTSRITLYFKEIEQCYLNVQKRLKTNLKPRRNLNSGCSSLFPRNLSRRSLCAVTDWKYQWILLATFHEHSTNRKASYAKPSLSRHSVIYFPADLKLVMRRTC